MCSTEEHIARVIEGDVEHYRPIIEAYEAKVRVVIAAMIPDPAMVDDLVQEVFIIACNRLSSYERGTQFAAWLRAVARNVAQNERRRWYRERELKQRYQAEIEKRVETNIDRIVDSFQENVLDALRQCMDRLRDRARALVTGFYFKELTVKELAAEHELSDGSVKVALFRARHSIADCMRGKGVMSRG